MRKMMLMLALASLVSCATAGAENDEVAVGQTEDRPGRSVEWLKKHCPDCLGRGPRVRP